jgi:YegS/Rv2252/BmrU family lipid kinase
MARIACIVNPQSANGRTGKRWPAIAQALGAHLGEPRAYFTEGPRHATELARRALEEGAELVISVGGDGTNNEVLNGLFADGKPVNPEAAMAVIPGGTGGDFARLLAIPKDPTAAAKRLAESKRRVIDVGRLSCTDHGGQVVSHMFLNIASFGLGGEVDARVNRTTKIFGGLVSFLYATTVSMFTFKNRPVRLRVDDVLDEERVIQQVSAANGQYFGGRRRPLRHRHLWRCHHRGDAPERAGHLQGNPSPASENPGPAGTQAHGNLPGDDARRHGR